LKLSIKPIPGWYPDPSGAARQRYWDGHEWTGHAPPPQQLSRTALWITLSIIAMVAVFFAGCSALIATGAQSHTTTSEGSYDGPTAMPGTPVVDGDFEFVVTGVATPANWHGDPQPRGQWIIATVTVRNTDDEPQSFMTDNQKLIDSAGRTYMADAMAAVRMNNDSMVIDVRPGVKITMKVPFDVPTATLPAALELHDSVFTDGTRVRVN
jgi:hypothetical protein